MYACYKLGFILAFLSITSICQATNQSSFSDDDFGNDYGSEYYDDNDDNEVTTTNKVAIESSTPAGRSSMLQLLGLRDLFTGTTERNYVREPSCPKKCTCLKDYTYIQCSHRHLTDLPQNLPATANTIDLSNNRIRELRRDSFLNYSQIATIHLNHNEISKIESESFAELKKLQNLYLANNQLTHLNPNTFSLAKDLHLLDLSNNTIELPEDKSFLNQPRLLQLICKNCTWSRIYNETFANLSALTTLRLDQNDFHKEINTASFRPLVNLIKLGVPELDKKNIQELCNVLKSIDNISFKHFDISCYELVLGTSFNESILNQSVAEGSVFPPLLLPSYRTNVTAIPQQQHNNTNVNSIKPANGVVMSENIASLNSTLNNSDIYSNANETGVDVRNDISSTENQKEAEGNTYQVPVSEEAINYMLFSIMIIAAIGLVIGIICRKDIGGIKTKFCRTRKPESKDQVHPAEEIPLNKLA